MEDTWFHGSMNALAGSMWWTDVFLCMYSIISFVLIIYFYLHADGRNMVLWMSTPETQCHSLFIWLKCTNNHNIFITWRSAIWQSFVYLFTLQRGLYAGPLACSINLATLFIFMHVAWFSHKNFSKGVVKCKGVYQDVICATLCFIW